MSKKSQTIRNDPLAAVFPVDFADLHKQVRELLLETTERSEWPGQGLKYPPNRKGDEPYSFDRVTDQFIRRWIVDNFESGTVISEESSEDFRFGQGAPLYRFIVDPVDGSDNFRRGLPLSAFSIAVLPHDAKVAVDQVCFAMVGGIEQSVPWVAARCQGAWQGKKRLRVSRVRHLREAFLSCELNHYEVGSPLAKLLARARGVRTFGCAPRAIALVAQGALDAHLDIRSRLTPESFLGAALILTEAGGCICRADGTPLKSFPSILSRTTVVVAATTDLAEEIIHDLVQLS